MRNLFFIIILIFPLALIAQKAPVKTTPKSPVKQTVKKIDTAKKSSVAKVVLVDSTGKQPFATDSIKKAVSKKTAKPADSLKKKKAIKGTIKPADSLAKKSTVKPSKVDSIKKGQGKESKQVKGWFEISGVDSTDMKESLLKKNAEEWFSNWFTLLSDRYPSFKSSEPDSINPTKGYFRGHGRNQFKDELSQNRVSQITMDYKTEVKVKDRAYQYRFYDFKIKSTLSQNGKVVSEETITDIDQEKEKVKQTKDAFKSWRLKRLQEEMQLLLDSFQNIMMQTPQRLNPLD
ncbi:hypothetical protein [Solitalea lacus]|uniref:hypothetical protein n=1 Tax=Solitalea lacus TaxID=2911172 RepID=UPI001EDB443C|nr:hypothetical protein [Solitalea lacus]UKJ09324.1 hypothetical protein L2B55_09220 [Solitalea lacus]